MTTTSLLAVIALAATTAPPGTADAELSAYCEAVTALETFEAGYQIDVDFATASPDEIAVALGEFRDALRPLADAIVAAAPAELASDIELMSNALDQVGVVEGDPFAEPDVVAAVERAHAYDLANCGWQQISLTAIDYHFTGELPTSAGITSFDMVNEGEEFHVAILGRKLDTVTLPVDEAFAAVESEEQFGEYFEFVGEMEAGPGSGDYMVVDLAPGEYVLLCPVPVGSTGETEGSGPPHFVEGMVSFFTVVES